MTKHFIFTSRKTYINYYILVLLSNIVLLKVIELKARIISFLFSIILLIILGFASYNKLLYFNSVN